MRRFGAVGRALRSGLDHPWLARVSIVTWGIGSAGAAITFLARRLRDSEPVAVVAVALMVLGLAVFGAHAISRWRRRRLRARRPDRLAGECREFAEELEIFADARRHEPAVKSNTLSGGWRQPLSPRLGKDGSDDGGYAALYSFRAETLRVYQERFRRPGKQLLDRIAAKVVVDPGDFGRLADPQSVDEIAAVADMFRGYVNRLTPLPARIEALVREGFRIQEMVHARPLAVQTEPGTYRGEGEPYPDLVERVAGFRERCMALLREGEPTVRGVFADAANAFLSENGGPRSMNIQEAMAGAQRDSLLLEVQSCMCGLRAAQDELGRRADRQLSRSRAS